MLRFCLEKWNVQEVSFSITQKLKWIADVKRFDVIEVSSFQCDLKFSLLNNMILLLQLYKLCSFIAILDQTLVFIIKMSVRRVSKKFINILSSFCKNLMIFSSVDESYNRSGVGSSRSRSGKGGGGQSPKYENTY